MEDQSIKGTVYFNLEVEESSLNFLKGVGLLRCGAVTARGVFFLLLFCFLKVLQMIWISYSIMRWSKSSPRIAYQEVLHQLDLCEGKESANKQKTRPRFHLPAKTEAKPNCEDVFCSVWTSIYCKRLFAITLTRDVCLLKAAALSFLRHPAVYSENGACHHIPRGPDI